MDALISDNSMPEIDGYELIRTVRRLGKASDRRLHAVAVTAYTGHDVNARALAAGFDAHATKPLDPAHLVQLLVTLRAGHRA
jgi:CheY-like chemotaxis protein